MKKRKIKSKPKNKIINKSDTKTSNLKKTLIATFFSSFIAILLAISIQLNGQKSTNGCSYLDPIIIDILAFLAGIFLIIEGLARVYEHPNATIKRQLTRIIRIMAGFGILTLHVMQFIHK
jgi:Na+/H+ antiporter NhaD/arsenite permease-like protein|tara:strand:- start:179 stop:538 length:360 start_codon:yes stop_codon:yes gene_type:complete